MVKKLEPVQLLIVIILLLVGSATVLGARAQGEGRGEAEETGPVQLVYWDHQFPWLVEWNKETIQEYTQQNPEVKIDFMIDYAHQRMLPAMYAGKGPDLAAPHGPKVINLMMMGYLSPVQLDGFEEFDSIEELEADWFPNSLSPFKDAEGNVYAMPLEYDVPGLIVNRKLFEMAGLDTGAANMPGTWDEVGEVGGKIFQAIGKEGDEVVYEGWDWAYHYRESWQRVHIRTAFAQYGAAFLNSDGEVVVDSPQAVEAMQMMKDMIHKYKTGDPNAIPGAEGYDWQLFNGRMAMGRFLAGEITKMVTAEEVTPYIEVYRWPKPAGKETIVTVRTHAWMVNGRTPMRNQVESWRFINFMTKKWKDFSIIGFNPARMIQPDVGGPWYESSWFKQQQEKYQSIREMPFDALAKGDVVWETSKKLYGTDEGVLRNDEITDAVARAQERIIFRNEDVAKNLQQAKKEIEQMLMIGQ
jgi:ABC-type glycerol-3-phosphate transport system substrate-binding protein